LPDALNPSPGSSPVLVHKVDEVLFFANQSIECRDIIEILAYMPFKLGVVIDIVFGDWVREVSGDFRHEEC
jgi:hypothetical protein